MTLILGTMTFASAQSNSTNSSNDTLQSGTFSVKFASTIGSGGTVNLNFPQGIAADNSGNIYVADSDNNRIVKFDPEGNLLETIGSTGSGDGQLLFPVGVAVDKSGNVYVADVDNFRIEKFDPSGKFLLKFSTSIGGDVTDPRAIAVDDSGNIYVADMYNPIEKFDPSGNLISTIGNYEISGTQGIALDKSGNIYALDNGKPQIVEFSSDGTFIKEWGSICKIYTKDWCVDPDGTGPFELGDGQFYDPIGIAIDDSGNVYVTDPTNNRIEIFDANGHFFYKFNPIAETGAFGEANGIAVYNGKMYVVDQGKYQVSVFDITYGNTTSAPNTVLTSPTMYSYTPQNAPGVPQVAQSPTSALPTTGSITAGYVSAFGSEGSKNGQFSGPQGIALDSSGNVYVADAGNNRVEKFDPAGNFMSIIGSGGSGDGQFSYPTNVLVDKSGNLYVTDLNNYRIEKFDPSGNFILKFGMRGNDDGQFQNPRDMAIDASGNLYVADLIHPIQKFDPAGHFISEIGRGQIEGAQGVALDKSGNIYALDNGSPQVVEFSSDGAFIKKWGSKCDMYDKAGCTDPDGSGPLELGDGQFLSAGDIAVDKSGNIFVTDLDDRVEVFDPSGHFIYKFGSSGTYGGQFANPIGIAIDDSGKIYVVDQHNNRVETFDVNSMNISGLAHDAIPSTASTTTMSVAPSQTMQQVTPPVPQATTLPVISAAPVPAFVKNYAKEWSTDEITTTDFSSNIKYMMDQKIITSPQTSTPVSSSSIPTWMKDTAKWWADGEISDSDFVSAVQYLVDQNIIKIKN